jgi:hypothetical protein
MFKNQGVREEMIYYRVALKSEQSSAWKWRSTAITSLNALFQLLKPYNSVPQDQIRVFFSSSQDNMDGMLNRQNEGLITSSVTARELLAGQPINTLEVTKLELELNDGGDHDIPYEFTLPASLPQLLAWTRLMHKVRNGELEP